MDQKLQIIIEMLRVGDAKGAISELEKLGATQGKVETATKSSKEEMTEFGQAVVGMAAKMIGWAEVIREGINFAKESVTAFEEQKISIDRLGGSMRAAGTFSKEYSDEVRDLADELQDLTKVDNGAILDVSSTLIQFGATRDELPKFLEMVLNMKAAGIEMQSSASAIGAGLQGQFGPLQKLLKVDFPEGTSRADKLAQSIALLEQRFGGLAQSTAGGVGGMKDLHIELQNLKEGFGEIILTGIEPYIRHVVEDIKNLKAVSSGAMTNLFGENSKGLQDQLVRTRENYAAIIESRVEMGRLTQEEGQAMDELLHKLGTEEEVYRNLKQIGEALRNGTSLAPKTPSLDPNRNYDPELAKRELADLEKLLELRKGLAALARPRTIDDTAQGVMVDARTQRDALAEQLGRNGTLKAGEVEKLKDDSAHQYMLEFIELAKQGREVSDELYWNAQSQREQELHAIELHFRERGEMLKAYYDFEVEKAGENAAAVEGINAERAEAFGRLLKEQMRAQSEMFQLFQKVGQAGVQSFSSGISSAFVEFVRGTKTAEEAFKEFASSFLAQIAQMILQQVIFNAIKNSSLGGFLGMANGGVAAPGGVRLAADGGMFGTVSSPTFFPKFNTLTGEAGTEVLAVLSRPRVENFNGMSAQVGNVGNRRMALMDADQLAAAMGGAGARPQGPGGLPHGGAAGGSVTINVALEPGLLAAVRESSIQGAKVAVMHDLGTHSDMNAAVRKAVGGT